MVEEAESAAVAGGAGGEGMAGRTVAGKREEDWGLPESQEVGEAGTLRQVEGGEGGQGGPLQEGEAGRDGQGAGWEETAGEGVAVLEAGEVAGVECLQAEGVLHLE